MINSKEYWEDRFDSNDWEEHEGASQTYFFYKVLIEHLPKWLIDEIQLLEYTIADLGCAEGEGTFLLKNNFINSDITGIDFSENAILKARQKFPSCIFENKDIMNIDKNFDVVFSSNVIEHFVNPNKIISKIISYSNNYCIIMLPFREKELCDEHFNVFNYSSFNMEVNNYRLVYYKVIDTSKLKDSKWIGEQIILIYSSLSNENFKNFKLSYFNNNDYDILKREKIENSFLRERIKEYDKVLLEYENKIEDQKNEYENKIEDQKNEYENKIEDQKNEYENKIEDQKNEYENKIEDQKNEYENKENMLFNEKNYILEKNNILSNILDNFIYEIECILKNKSTKFIHLASRIKNQFIKGNISEKIKFFKWLFNRKKYGCLDHRFNPIYGLYNVAKNKRNEYIANENYEIESVFLKHFNHIKDYSTYALNMSQTAISKKIENIIENWSGDILIYPHVVKWEPLQTPQQLVKAFAEKGWLCFFCDTQIESKLEIVSDNVYLVCETDLLQALKDRKVVVLLTWMLSMAFIDNLKNKKIWYHILDQLDIFSYYDSEYKKVHDRMILEADIVSYVAKPLEKYSVDLRNDAIYLPNAVNPKDFLNIHDDFVPDDIQDILYKRKKIIGYYGYISEWFNLEWIEQLSKNRKEYEIVIIGPYTVDISKFDNIDNVSFLGLKPYKELSDYAKFFDVAIIPFLINEMMDCVSPIKFYEYCALGKPVVTSYMKEMVSFENEFVRCVSTYEDFEKNIVDILCDEEILNKAKYEMLKIVNKNTWINRAEKMILKF
ncbi:methyltransferase domain protein [Peptoanaerobacter stomatis]|uniref:Methyltransferase domain protein n=1 Tax=Peptoanaerobacter stomatis TaxID=796937 RepID=J5ULH7_9FIRM|nr:methyltransferase domain-containing protein [Peptoanaerobacter stomatis]EJU23459.1 methyltransferase domain protein [Peptoanaerobacter stomatis]